MQRFTFSIGLISLALAMSSSCQAESDLEFSARDVDGNQIQLKQHDQRQLTVVCFLGTECPLAKLYGPRLQRFADSIPNVRFIGVFSNSQDSVDDIRDYQTKHDVSFPLIKDQNNVIADKFEAKRTPEVFLLDQNLHLHYRGRVDDQYQPGIAKPKPRRQDLEIAITECLSDQPVSVASTQPDGCLIGRVRTTKLKSHVTYANQISRLVRNHCSECHQAGQIGPMNSEDYDEIVGWADMMLEVIEDGRMPPWHADPEYGSFVNERRVSKAEKQMFRDWVDAGTPSGDLKTMPPTERAIQSSPWRLPKEPDLVVSMRDKPFPVPATGTIEYQYYVVDPGFKQDRWITAAEIIPGDPSVLHHSIVFVRPPDGTGRQGIGWLAAYVPGQSAPVFNPKYGRRIPAGSKLVFQQHYTPVGHIANDTTRIGLVFGDDAEIEHEVFTLLALDQEFVIPPNAENYKIKVPFSRLPRGGMIRAFSPHMHVRGKSFEVVARPANSEESQTLLNVPKYDFNWQHIYQLQTPIPTASLDSLHFNVTFDNSENNPANPNPNEQVSWGDQTWQEMAVGFVIVSQPRNLVVGPTPPTPEQQTLAENHKQFIRGKSQAHSRSFFQKFDANQDGFINRSELPRSMSQHVFWQTDMDQDGKISPAEVQQAAESSFRKRHKFDPNKTLPSNN